MSVPLPAGLSALMKFTTSVFDGGLGSGGPPGASKMPKTLTAGTVPCLRTPIPAAPLLPALVLPKMFRKTESLALAALPASTRMPWRAVPPALTGALTVLSAILSFAVPDVPRPTSRIPFPSVPLIVLLVTVSVRFGVHALPAPATPLPPAMPLPPPRLGV